MAKPKAPRSLVADFFDEGDSDAPEAVSFGASKQSAKGEQVARAEFASAEKRKRKEKNRGRDRALKERATQAKGKGKGNAGKNADVVEEGMSDEEDDEQKALQARMARAMKDAEDESDEGESSEGGSAVAEEADQGEWGGFGGGGEEDEDMNRELLEDEESEEEGEGQEFDDENGDEYEESEGENEDEDEEDEEDEDEENVPPSKRPRKDYLPDHLFASAFAASPSKPSSKPSRPSKPIEKAQKRKRSNGPGKDVLLGSRTIRTLPPLSAAIPSVENRRLVPPARVEKFVRRSLNLKGSAAETKAKGWERRAANLGVMKRNGPAANFVRAR